MSPLDSEPIVVSLGGSFFGSRGVERRREVQLIKDLQSRPSIWTREIAATEFCVSVFCFNKL